MVSSVNKWYLINTNIQPHTGITSFDMLAMRIRPPAVEIDTSCKSGTRVAYRVNSTDLWRRLVGPASKCTSSAPCTHTIGSTGGFDIYRCIETGHSQSLR